MLFKMRSFEAANLSLDICKISAGHSLPAQNDFLVHVTD